MHGESQLINLALSLLFLWLWHRHRSQSPSPEEQKHRRVFRMLDPIARQVGGFVAVSGRTLQPVVRFRRNRAACEFVYGTRLSGAVECVSLEVWADGRGLFEAVSNPKRRQAGRLRHLEDMTPPPSLEGLALRATDQVWAENFLNAGVAGLLAELRRWSHAPFELQVTPVRVSLLLQRRITPRDAERMLNLVDRLLRFSLTVSDPTGVAILAIDSASPEGQCPVCGTLLSEPQVRCDACGSPQHADCWDYVGRCAIFGCGSDKVAIPKPQ